MQTPDTIGRYFSNQPQLALELVNRRRWTYPSTSGNSMDLGPISATLWHISIAAKILLVAVLVLVGVYRRFPIFFAYAVALAIRSLVLWIISQTGTYATYFYVFWASQAVLAGLGLAVVAEVYRHSLAVFPSLRKWTGPALSIALIGLLLMCIWAALTAPANFRSLMVAGLIVLERSVWSVQAGLLVVLVLAAAFVGMTFRTPSFGMALGLGLYSATELAMLGVITLYGEAAARLQVLGGQLGFLVAVVVWFTFVLRFRSVSIPCGGSLEESTFHEALSTIGSKGMN